MAMPNPRTVKIARGDSGEASTRSRSPRSNSAETACAVVCEIMIEKNSQNTPPPMGMAAGPNSVLVIFLSKCSTPHATK